MSRVLRLLEKMLSRRHCWESWWLSFLKTTGLVLTKIGFNWFVNPSNSNRLQIKTANVQVISTFIRPLSEKHSINLVLLNDENALRYEKQLYSIHNESIFTLNIHKSLALIMKAWYVALLTSFGMSREINCDSHWALLLLLSSIEHLSLVSWHNYKKEKSLLRLYVMVLMRYHYKLE